MHAHACVCGFDVWTGCIHDEEERREREGRERQTNDVMWLPEHILINQTT